MTSKQKMNPVDDLINEFDKVLRSIVGVTPMRRPIPKPPEAPIVELSVDEKKHSAGLMRINHVGEVCAQALYQSQKLRARNV